MKFGVCCLVVLDNGSPFKYSFVDMYKYLDLNYDVPVKRNHKDLTVEYFHRFFNKVTTVSMEDREINDGVVPTEITMGIRGIVTILMVPTYYKVSLLLNVTSSF